MIFIPFSHFLRTSFRNLLIIIFRVHWKRLLHENTKMGILEYSGIINFGILEYFGKKNLGILEILFIFAPKTHIGYVG